MPAIPGYRLKKLASFIKTYAVGFSVAHHIAQTITKLHSVLSEKMNRLHETERSLRDISRTYVEVISLLENESQSRHFPWLFSMVEKSKNSAGLQLRSGVHLRCGREKD